MNLLHYAVINRIGITAWILDEIWENFKNLWKLQHNKIYLCMMENFVSKQMELLWFLPWDQNFLTYFCHHGNYGYNNVIYHLNHTFTHLHKVCKWYLPLSDIKHVKLFQQFMNSRHTNIKFSTEALYTIKTMFSNSFQLWNVVDFTYLGVTKQHQKSRPSEHIGISSRTEKALKDESAYWFSIWFDNIVDGT